MDPLSATITTEQIEIEVHIPAGGPLAGLAADARMGLSAPFKELPPKYFYDERGSQLFEEITRLPEYYPTRAERAILAARGSEIIASADPSTLMELGSGSAAKTRCLLDAMRDAGSLQAYVPVDISEEITRATAARLIEEYPGLRVHGVVCDYETHLERVPREPAGLIAFLGGTIGNFQPQIRRSFLARIASLMYPEDRFLLGTDLVKDRERLEAAYNDSGGVTAQFNKNLLNVLNRELGADFDPAAFGHVAFWDELNSWIDVRLRSLSEQTVTIPSLEMEVGFADGEEMRTEISAKFTRAQLEAVYGEAGLEIVDWWTDPDHLFALSLARRQQPKAGTRRRFAGSG
jgi:L-histidine N-alpha-methyltransferase